MVAVAIPGFAVVFLFIRSRRRVAAMKLASQEDAEKDVSEKPQLHSDSVPKALPQEMEDGVNTYP